MTETKERIKYRYSCKHFLPMSEGCAMQSGSSGGWHISMRCNGRCPRMKRYDRKQEKRKIAGNGILENRDN